MAERIAPHKVPQTIAVLDALPKGPTGKVVRREVAKQLAVTGPGKPDPMTAPKPANDDERAEQLRRVWCEVLNLDAISPDDDYFRLGGDSLRALTIINKAKTIGVELTMVDLMRHRSIRRICAAKTKTAA